MEPDGLRVEASEDPDDALVREIESREAENARPLSQQDLDRILGL